MKKNGLLLALAAGACVAPAAFAQLTDEANMPAIRAQAPVSFGDRVNQLVYAIPLASDANWRNLSTANSQRICGDDCSLVPGPGQAGNVTLNGAYFATVFPAGGTGSTSITVRIHIFNTFTGNWADQTDPGNGPADLSNPNWLGTMTFDLLNFNTPGFITFYDVPVNPTTMVDRNGATTAGINVPDADFYAELEVCEYQTTTLHSTVYPIGRGDSAGDPAPGSSNNLRWADIDNDGLVDVAAAELNPGNFRFVYLGFRADVPPPPVPTNTDLGCVADSGLVHTDTVADNTVKWFRVCLNGDALDASGQFLDIDTEGSTADVAMALYTADGTVAGNATSEDGDGSGTNDQLTYGIGRRAPVGDGRQYDGRDGELTAGTYYLAVGPTGSSFGPGFTASANGGVGGAITLNLRTNTNGTALGPSVAPDTFAINAGRLINPGAAGTVATTPRQEVVWHKFEFCGTNSGADYLDIDFSLITNPADSEAFLFNSAGDLVWSEDDDNGAGGYFQPQASFGAAGPRSYLPVAGQLEFNGQDGELAADTYYLAIGLFNSTATGSRWHVRSDSGSSLDVTADYYTSSAGVCTIGCGWRADGCFGDYDNSEGIDGDDVIAFFGDWDTSDLCADVDNSEGVDGDDVIAFFASWDVSGTGFPGC